MSKVLTSGHSVIRSMQRESCKQGRGFLWLGTQELGKVPDLVCILGIVIDTDLEFE